MGSELFLVKRNEERRVGRANEDAPAAGRGGFPRTGASRIYSGADVPATAVVGGKARQTRVAICLE